MMIVTCLAMLTLGLVPEQKQEGPAVRTQSLLVIEPSVEFPRNSEGDFVALSDGRIALVYTRFSGGRSDHAAADLCMRTTDDGGQSWSEDRVLVPNEGGFNVMSVSLNRLPSGEILLFYLRKNDLQDCRLLVRRSSDDLKTLSEPVLATPAPGYHVVNNDRVVRLKNGRLIIVASLHPSTAKTLSGFGIPRAFYSDDDGKTWQLDKTVVDPTPKFKVKYQEPGVLERKDGSLWMWMRTDGGSQFASVSTDQGVNWTAPQPTPLASPVSPATIERVPGSDRLVCVWNDHSGRHPFPKGKRTPLCLAISDDDGESWSPSIVLEDNPDGWYCYTAMHFTDDQLLLAFCAGDSKVGGLNRSKVTGVKLTDIKSLTP